VVYVTPGCFAHPKTRAFWLGGASGAGRVRSRGTVPRARWRVRGRPAVRGPAGTGSVGDGVGEGRAADGFREHLWAAFVPQAAGAFGPARLLDDFRRTCWPISLCLSCTSLLL